MSNQDPFRNFGANFVENKLGQSSRNEEILDISDYGLSQPNSWFQTTTHLNTSSAMMDDFNFNGYFGGLMMDAPVLTTASMQPDSGITLQPELPSEPDKGQSSGTVKIPDEKVVRKCKSEGIQATEEGKRIAKRTRSAEGHNLSERRRRDRINQRLKTLQELVPNSKKSDSATVLDNAANYLKFLKLQIELMSRGVGQVFQAPYMSLNEVAGSQVPQASQFMPIRPQLETGIGTGTETGTEMGMGMFGMCYPTSVPMLTTPATSLNPAFSGGVGMPLINGATNFAVPQVQMPFVNPQLQMPNFVSGFSPALNVSSQGNRFSSQAVSSTAIDYQQQGPMTNQESLPSGATSYLPMSYHAVTTS